MLEIKINSQGKYRGIIVPIWYFKPSNYPRIADTSELETLNQLIKDLNWYGIRHTEDDWDSPAFLGDSRTFLVNRYGVFFTKMELDEESLRNEYVDIVDEPFEDREINSFKEIPALLETL